VIEADGHNNAVTVSSRLIKTILVKMRQSHEHLPTLVFDLNIA